MRNSIKSNDTGHDPHSKMDTKVCKQLEADEENKTGRSEERVQVYMAD